MIFLSILVYKISIFPLRLIFLCIILFDVILHRLLLCISLLVYKKIFNLLLTFYLFINRMYGYLHYSIWALNIILTESKHKKTKTFFFAPGFRCGTPILCAEGVSVVHKPLETLSRFCERYKRVVSWVFKNSRKLTFKAIFTKIYRFSPYVVNFRTNKIRVKETIVSSMI